MQEIQCCFAQNYIAAAQKNTNSKSQRETFLRDMICCYVIRLHHMAATM